MQPESVGLARHIERRVTGRVARGIVGSFPGGFSGCLTRPQRDMSEPPRVAAATLGPATGHWG